MIRKRYKKTSVVDTKLNFLPRGKKRWPKWVKPVAKWGGIFVGGFLVLMLLMAAWYYPKLKPAITAAKQSQTIGRQLAEDISQQRFASADKRVVALQDQLGVIQKAVDHSKGLAYWPYIGTQYKTGRELVGIGQDSTVALGSLVDFLTHVFEPFSGQGKVSLASISPEEKGLLLKGISERETDLRSAQTAIHRASERLERIPEHGLVGPLQKVTGPLKQQFPLIAQALDQAIPATHLLPPVLGYPTQRSYLFLLQNNNELRPGGGFIGTYGLLKLKNGDIVSLKTDNSYNLDEAAKKLSVIAPPAPMQKYLKARAWYFRDSNWSPDFPTSAKQAIQFYEREGGQKNVDGVIAITPTTVSALLRLVGPITLHKIEFNADNFTDRLQDYVGQGFKQYGLTESQRKDIIGDMTSELVNRLLSLPVTEWKDLFLVLSEQFSQKQFLMYMQDDAQQSIVVQQNWGGAINGKDGEDYVMAVDANLASLKTDAVMKRTYTYDVKLDGDKATATFSIHYQHTGKFDFRTQNTISRYNTYIRVYVPSGAVLVDSKGAQLRERSQTAGKVTTTTELGRTVFDAFKSIEPGTTSDLVLTYTLPTAVAEQLQKNHYTLIWQKQPGMIDPQMNLTLSTPNHRPDTATGLDNQARLGKDSLTFTGSLDHDRSIVVNY